jgi:hypothetical protein
MLPGPHRTPIRQLVPSLMRNYRLHLLFWTNCRSFLTDYLHNFYTSVNPWHPQYRYVSLDSNLVLVLSICASHSADRHIYGGGGGIEAASSQFIVLLSTVISYYSLLFMSCQ